MSTKNFVIGALAGAVLLAASACGSSGSGTSGSGSSVASSTTFKLGYISDITGGSGALVPWEKAVQAYVEAANAKGGIKGHKIELDICDTQTNANGGAACGQKLVADHVFAVLDLTNETSAMPYLQAAGIPDLNIGQTPMTKTSPVSFSINDLVISADAGFAVLAKQAGCTNLAYVFDTPAAGATQAQSQAEDIKKESETLGLTYSGTIFGQSTVPDASPYIAQAIRTGAKCIVIDGLGAQEVSMLTALAAAPSDIKVLTGSTFLESPDEASSIQPLAKELGSRLIVLSATYPATETNIPAVKQYVADSKKYEASPPLLESISETYWADLQLLLKAADATYPNVTAANVLNYLNHLQSYNPGVSPSVTFAGGAPENPFGPRIFSAWVAPSKYADGGAEFPLTGPFVSLVNPST
jgi:ABC-type branched-subunit amino acid transport system substrate-binding protein